MKQLHGDIVIVEGLNELNVQMTPIVVPPVAVYTCVYCQASFNTEAALIEHMEGNHPGMPYVVYAYLEDDTIPQGESMRVIAKVFIPSGVQAGSWRFMFRFYGTYGTREDCAGKKDISTDMAEGFYMINVNVPTDYITKGWVWVDVPPGTYTVYSRGSFRPSGADRQTLWSGVDLGLRVTVV